MKGPALVLLSLALSLANAAGASQASPALATQETRPVEAASPRAATKPAPASATPTPEATGEPRGPRAVQLRLEELASTFPDRIALVSLGESAGGRPILAAALGKPGAPALLAADHAAGDRLEGGESLLRLVEHFVTGVVVGEDPLTDHRLFVVPTLDPDRSALVAGEGDEGAELGAVRFERDFPVGWRPPGLVRGAGTVPLTTPEARALTEFLAGRPNLVLAVGLEIANGTGELARDLEPADEAAQLLLAGRWIDWDLVATPRLAWTRPPRASGTWLDLARGVHGTYVAAAAWGDAGSSVDWEAAHEALRNKMLRLLVELPALSLGEPRVRRLGDGLWQVDLAFENLGLLPTLSVRALTLGRVGAGQLDVEGAELLAAARRLPGDVEFRVVVPQGRAGLVASSGTSAGSGAENFGAESGANGSGAAGRLLGGRVPLAVLGGGETGVVRLVVRASEGTHLALLWSSERAGGGSSTVELRTRP